MDAWWGSLDTSLRIFYAIGLGSGLALLVQLVMLFLGHDGGDGHDAIDGAGELPVLSLRAITAFFVGFGWTGVAALQAGYSVPVATAAGLGVGGAFMLAVAFLMRLLYGLEQSGNVDYRNAVGSHAKVYLTIAPRMEKAGQVEVLVQGRLRVVEAMTKADRTLPPQSRVKVVDLVDATTLLVEPE